MPGPNYKAVARLTVLGLAMSLVAGAAGATTWYVAPGGAGFGTSANPFGRIQDGIASAQAGDTVVVRAGTYAESLRTVRNGAAGQPVSLVAESGPGSVTVTVAANVLRVDHAYLVVDGFTFDAQYADADALDINAGATGLILRHDEVRRATRDCVDISSPSDVLIESSLIHHCLNAANGRTDAHGIVAGAVHNLTIRDTDIHTFSGDAFQADPGRSAPGWDDVTIEDCRFWLAPLAAPENGFPAGTVAGENAVDTKTLATAPRAHITIRNTQTWGFRGGLISNMAAFNLKENVDATVDRVTVWDSEIAFRVRGITPTTPVGAWVEIANAVVHDVATAVRYEDDVSNLRVWHTTIGASVTRAFQAASSSATLDVRDLAFYGATLPSQASGASNRALPATAFVDVATHDYHLAAASPAIDAGVEILGVSTDRDGVSRPRGAGVDVGAYEWCGLTCNLQPPLPPTNVRVIP